MEHQLDPVTYWKLKARFLELIMQEQQIVAEKARALRAAGLDPEIQFTMNDDTTTVSSKETA